MKSTSGEHFIALDHVRALAAFLVFTWHFTHYNRGYPVPFAYVPGFFPAAILDEGHTGVALFMTLSGYLFAKILDGKAIVWRRFIWNRTLRLLPLLVVVLFLVAIRNSITDKSFSLASYLLLIVQGVVLPTLPSGGWSITVEFHFYLLLPLLLYLTRRFRGGGGIVAVILSAPALRSFLYFANGGEIQTLAYWTIVGRIDQFALGMLAFGLRRHIEVRHISAAVVATLFLLFYWWFDAQGGYHFFPSYPSTSPLWIVMPTIEGFSYAFMIAWYDRECSGGAGPVSRFVSRLGEYSYSIYLLHFLVVFQEARFIHENVMNISNFYVAVMWSMVFFLAMMIPGYLSFRFIESPFLKLRMRYTVGPP